MFRSGARAASSSLIDPPTITNPVAQIGRPRSPEIREICATRVRDGYRRVHVLLCREGWDVNIKKAYRIYGELGLQLRHKTPKRRVKAKLRDDRRPATAPNETWAMDFVHDQLATGKKIRVLTVVDTFSRFSPVVDSRFSYRAEDVVSALERVCANIGYPKTIRVDQGSEWPAAGSVDTEIRCFTEPEVEHGAASVQSGVQARGCQVGSRARRKRCAGGAGLEPARKHAAALGQGNDG